jgi:GNAT superfamily N-acetyltransferase
MRQRDVRDDPSALVGRRVVVRYRLHGAEFGATDVLGAMEAWSGGTVRVARDRDGVVVDIAEADVLAVKAVPARPVPRREIRDLEAAAALGWRALDVEQLGGWRLSAASGFTSRANSCLPLADPGLPIADAVDHVTGWYQQRGLTPAFRVPDLLGQALDNELDQRGWERADDVIAMTASIDDVRHGVRSELPEVRITDRPDPAWLDLFDDEGLPAAALDVLLNAETVGFASIDENGERLAITRGAVTDAPSGRRWLGLTAVVVVPGARRRGLATRLVTALAGWAAGHGATDAYLQVLASNTAAQSAYRKLGFADHHYYHYRHQPSPASHLRPTRK